MSRPVLFSFSTLVATLVLQSVPALADEVQGSGLNCQSNSKRVEPPSDPLPAQSQPSSSSSSSGAPANPAEPAPPPAPPK